MTTKYVAGEKLEAGDAVEIGKDGKAYKVRPKPKLAPHGEYEIINPSDKCFLTGAGEPLAAACLFLGRGRYALRDKAGNEGCPLFLFGGHDVWWQETFGRTFDAYMNTKPYNEIAVVLETFRYDGQRSSLKNIGKAAKTTARSLRAKAKEGA